MKFVSILILLSTPLVYSCNKTISPGGSGTSQTHYTRYIITTGQSNAVGYGPSTGDTTTNPNVLAWECNSAKYVVMGVGRLPMGRLTPTGQADGTYPNANNATWQFAKQLQQATGDTIKVLLFAWGNNTIYNWYTAGAPNYHFMDSVLTGLNVKGNYFIWDQGETDKQMPDSLYRSMLTDILSHQIRPASWLDPSARIVLTGLSSEQPAYGAINSTLQSMQSIPDNIYFAPVTGLNTIDSTHFTGNSLQSIGSEYFQLFTK